MKNDLKKIKIITIPDKRLRQVSLPVTEFDNELTKLVNNLQKVLSQQKEPLGLGISSPQIGVLKRVFVALIPPLSKSANFRSFINPKISNSSSKKIVMTEGCLSVPLYYGHVIRPAEIDLSAQNESGKSFKRHYKGLSARVIQHEVDHLNGILFIDHVHTQNGKLYKVVGKDTEGKEKFEEVAFA